MNGVASLKGRFPFRLGTSSYILPDDILPNVDYLSDKVDDVELVLFESDEFSNLPDADVVRRLAEWGEARDVSYTVHFPLDIELGSRVEAVRRASVDKCKRIVERMADVHPFAWILHFHGDRRGRLPSSDVPAWRDALMRSAEELVQTGLVRRDVCIETLDYPLALVDEVLEQAGFSVCLDAGHLWLAGRSPAACLARYGPRVRVIHLHGVRGDEDHRDLTCIERAKLGRLLDAVGAGGEVRVVTMEIFSEEDFRRSMAVMEELTPWAG